MGLNSLWVEKREDTGGAGGPGMTDTPWVPWGSGDCARCGQPSINLWRDLHGDWVCAGCLHPPNEIRYVGLSDYPCFYCAICGEGYTCAHACSEG